MSAVQPEPRISTSGRGAYRPTARRPIAALFRRTADGSVRLGIHPDMVSCASIVAAAGAGIALAAGTASARGEVFNEGPDRVADVLIFTGVAHSGLGYPLSGYWATIFALLTAYVGMLGQAVVARRQFGGVMSKPWRTVAPHVGAWLTLAQLWRGGATGWAGLSVPDWTCLAIVAGCVQTIIVRLAGIFRKLPRGTAVGGESRQEA